MKPSGRPSGPFPITNTPSSSPRPNSVSSAITNPFCGSPPRHVVGDPLQLQSRRRRHVRRPRDLHGVALALEPLHGLAHLADRAALERERGDVEHCLVAVIDRPQLKATVERERILGRPEHGHPPAAAACEDEEAREQRLQGIRLSDRVAGHDRHAADDTVGEERVLVRREEVRLVRAQCERRERVCPPGAYERSREVPFRAGLGELVPPRRDGSGERPRDAGGDEDEHRQREPTAEGRLQMPCPHTERADEGLVEGKPEAEGPVGSRAVDPDRGDPEQRHGRQGDGKPDKGSAWRCRVRSSAKIPTHRDERDEHDGREDSAVVETVKHVQRDRDRQQHDCRQPRNPLPPCDPTSREEQRHADRHPECRGH